jgi:PAS domain S-box-containing protein
MTILIVEDDSGLAELMKEKVEDCGAVTTCVRTAGEALNWLKENTPYLMILDFSLPDMNAKEFIAELKIRELTVPSFIVCTGQGDERIAVDMMKLGAMDYIAKGSHFLDMLPEVVRRVEREIENENKRKWMEDKLRESEERYRLLIETVNEGILVAQGANLKFVNPMVLELTGHTEGDLLSLPFLEFIHHDDRELVRNNYLKRLKGEAVDPRYHFRVLKNDKSIRWVEMSGVKIEWEGQPATLNFVTDVTDRKQAEADKEELEVQNRQLQKAESLARMAGAIAHLFNNQLGVVIGNLDLAMMELSQGTLPHANITSAMKASQQAAEVSGQMLTYLGQAFDKRESLDLSDACRRSLPMVRAVMPKDMVLKTDLPSHGPAIHTNANYIHQILTNLITNAWEAVGEGGGSIHLGVKTVYPADIPTAHRFPIVWQPDENAYACLEVTDAGCGIADKDIEKIFDPFFSEKFTGRGMGLAVVMGIVRAHGGVVTVESEPGRGSIFRAYFPVYAEGADKATPDQERRGSQGNAGRRREDGH